ncbi:MAG: DUF4159 domain-containing protein [Candidatus Eisenbacteria bacterium]
MTVSADKTCAAGPAGGFSPVRGFVRAAAVLLVVACSVGASADPDGGFTIAQLKYRGGGDWYANPTALPNLLAGLSSRTDLEIAQRPATVAPDDDELFLYPMIHMTGHGRVAFTDEEASALREYFERGGFLWADDNYGMDRHFRAQLDRILPGAPLVELPFAHEIFHSFYEFPEGLPKIHEHDGGAPHGYGVYLDGRMVVFYSFNTDIGDGLEDGEVHNDPPEKREAALRMGVNIAVYALSH